MPRSYSFDHYTAQKHDVSRSLQAEEKRRLQEAGGEGGETGIHYGKRHAQTEQILAARQMAQELEKASMEDELEQDEGLKEMYGQLQELAEREEPLEELAPQAAAETKQSTPIGSVPAAGAPPPPSLWREVTDQAQRDLRSALLAARELSRAGGRLVRLPADVARLLAQRLNPLRWA